LHIKFSSEKLNGRDNSEDMKIIVEWIL